MQLSYDQMNELTRGGYSSYNTPLSSWANQRFTSPKGVEYSFMRHGRYLSHEDVVLFFLKKANADADKKPAPQPNTYGIVSIGGAITWGFTKEEALEEAKAQAKAWSSSEIVVIKKVATAKMVTPPVKPYLNITIIEGE